jgi:hypothetical protein
MSRKTDKKVEFPQLKKKAADVAEKALEPDPWEKKKKANKIK